MVDAAARKVTRVLPGGSDPEAEDLPNVGTAEARAARGWRVGNPYWTGPSDRIEYRLRGSVARLRAYFVRSPELRVPLRRVSMTGSPPLLGREAWGANEAIRRAPPSYATSLQFALVHHTAGSNSYTASQSAAIVRGIEDVLEPAGLVHDRERDGELASREEEFASRQQAAEQRARENEERVRAGRVSTEFLRQWIPDPTSCWVYACGPAISGWDRKAAREAGVAPAGVMPIQQPMRQLRSDVTQ